MTRILPALASASLLALGLVALPAGLDLQQGAIGFHAAYAAKGGNGHGGGKGHGQDKSGSSAGAEASSTDTTEGEGEEKSLPEQAIQGKTNSSAYHSANSAFGSTETTTLGGKTPNENSAVSYSQPPSAEAPTGETPTGEEPVAEEPTTEEPTEETPVVEGETPPTEEPGTL